MRVLTGSSGFSYKEWRGSFYPEDLPERGFLAHYAGRFPTVEVNNTFYRMPRRELLERWASQVGDGFRFTLKASRRITHLKKLRNVAEEVQYLHGQAGVLGTKLGALLFQMPPTLRRDDALLSDFLATLPEDWSAALEFRHASWFDDAVYDLLREGGAALVASDSEKLEAVLEPTAPFGYVRLRRDGYGDAALRSWAARLAEQPWERVYVYFKHDDSPPEPALRFQELAGGGPA